MKTTLLLVFFLLTVVFSPLHADTLKYCTEEEVMPFVVKYIQTKIQEQLPEIRALPETFELKYAKKEYQLTEYLATFKTSHGTSMRVTSPAPFGHDAVNEAADHVTLKVQRSYQYGKEGILKPGNRCIVTLSSADAYDFSTPPGSIGTLFVTLDHNIPQFIGKLNISEFQIEIAP